jgi:hypothetical protein
MAALSTRTGNGIFKKSAGALVIATLVVAGAGVAQAGDSTERIVAPTPAEIAVLRGLLALQHPSLRQGASVQVIPAAVVPAVTTEPNQPATNAPAKTEGEACVAPASTIDGSCGYGAETAATRSQRLGSSFRESLERSMAAAGFSAKPL